MLAVTQVIAQWRMYINRKKFRQLKAAGNLVLHNVLYLDLVWEGIDCYSMNSYTVFCTFRNCVLQALETCFNPALRQALSRVCGCCQEVIPTCTCVPCIDCRTTVFVPFWGIISGVFLFLVGVGRSKGGGKQLNSVPDV